MVILSSRSHRGRNSVVFPTRAVAIRRVTLAVHRNDNVIYLYVARSHHGRLSLPVVMRGGADTCNANFAIAVRTTRNIAANISTTSHVAAIHTTVTSNTGPSSLGHPNRIFPLHTRTNNMLAHNNRARTAVSLVALTNFGPTNILYRLAGSSNAVTHTPRYVRFTGGRGVTLIAVRSLITCHRTRRHGTD